MSTISQDAFRQVLNSNFIVKLGNHQAQLKLIECSDQTSNEVPDFERFSLLFESSDSLLEQSTYSLHHDELGTSELFLVPVHGDDRGYQYEAIINRKKDQ